MDLILKFIDGKKWEVVQPFEYDTKKGEKIIIPAGYQTDFATIPRFLWEEVGLPSDYGRPAIVHDYCLDKCLYPRKKCDEIFLELMRLEKINPVKRVLFFVAVRVWSIFRALKK